MNPLDEFLKRDYAQWRDAPFLHHEAGSCVTARSFGQFIEDVNYVGQYLVDLGLKGRNVGIYSPNSIEWMTIDAAVMNYIGISAGFSKEWGEEDVKYGIAKCDIACLFYSKKLELVVDRIRADFPDVRFLCIEEAWAHIIAAGKQKLQEMFCLPSTDIDDVARIVFTSGTTSFPKAVMLTHRNIFGGWKTLTDRVQVDNSDLCYLFLPLNHTYGGIYNFIYSLVFGFQLCLAVDVHNMAEELMKVKPTIFCSVPKLCIGFLAAARARSIPLGALYGGRIRYLFCGGAMLPRDVLLAYNENGLRLLNAYALSETASSFSVDRPGDPVLDSAGTLCDGVEVTVLEPDENGVGELAIRGDVVFRGYYGDEEATRSAFNSEGFFLTGDLGYLKDKHVYITGRKDSRLTLANGENVSSRRLAERVLALDQTISGVKVYLRDGSLVGDIYINGYHGEEDIQRKLDLLIAQMNNHYPSYERINRYNLRAAEDLLK